MKEKTCRRCLADKPLTEFGRVSANADGRNVYCKTCVREKSRASHSKNRTAYNARKRAWRKANPDASRIASRKHRVGITEVQFQAMLKMQGGRCAICRSADWKNKNSKTFHVDHCHRTERIRGLLCHKCNAGIGHFDDNPETLARAIAYLTLCDIPSD